VNGGWTAGEYVVEVVVHAADAEPTLKMIDIR
jgi:hypothetical protein